MHYQTKNQQEARQGLHLAAQRYFQQQQQQEEGVLAG
jgi:hypothetical protein